MVALPINIPNLLRHRTVESERIEYKAAWNPDAVIRKILKAMTANSSPPPRFDTDDRSGCLVRLPVHPLAQWPNDQSTPEVTPQVTPQVTPEVRSNVWRFHGIIDSKMGQ